jgi:ABC-type phosphate transport system substrate-binding protein
LSSRRVHRWRLAVGSLFAFACCSAEAAEDVVVVVSAKSPPIELTNAQVTDIFLGRSARFPDGSRAVPIDLREGTALRQVFYAMFVGRSDAQVKAHWSKIIFTGRGQPPRQVSDADAARALVARTPGTITYLSPFMVDASVRVVARADDEGSGND